MAASRSAPWRPRAEWLDVACGQCARKGRVRLAGLVARYGADFPMTRLRRELAEGCPRLQPGTQLADQCDVYFPGLGGIMDKGQGVP